MRRTLHRLVLAAAATATARTGGVVAAPPGFPPAFVSFKFARRSSSLSTPPPCPPKPSKRPAGESTTPLFPQALSTVERMKVLRAQAQQEEEEGAPAAAAAPGGIDEARHRATVLSWLQTMVIGYKLCPWAAPALNADAIKVVVHPEGQDLDGLVATVLQEAAVLSSLPEGPEGRNLTTLIAVPGPLLADFQDFLDLAATVDDCLDEVDLRGLVQLASFHPQYKFADSTNDVENYTNRSPLPLLHLLREMEITRALEGYVGDPAKIYQRNKAVMREAGAERLEALLAACNHPPPHPSREVRKDG